MELRNFLSSTCLEERDRSKTKRGTPNAEILHTSGELHRGSPQQHRWEKTGSTSHCHFPTDTKLQTQTPRLARSSSAKPDAVRQLTAFRFDAFPPQSAPESPRQDLAIGSQRRSASADSAPGWKPQTKCLSIAPLNLPLLLPPMPELPQLKSPSVTPCVQPAQLFAPPAPLGPPTEMFPGAGMSSLAGSLLVPGPSKQVRLELDSPGGSSMAPAKCTAPLRPDAASPGAACTDAFPPPHKMGYNGNPVYRSAALQSRSCSAPSLLGSPSTGGHLLALENCTTPIKPSVASPEAACAYAEAACAYAFTQPQRIGYNGKPVYRSAALQSQSHSAPSLQRSLPTSGWRTAFGQLSHACRSRDPVPRGAVSGDSTNMSTFGVVCGQTSSPSSVFAESSSSSELRSVARRMNNLLAMCRNRLDTSRRKAKRAEKKLENAEHDFRHILYDVLELETECEVARCLFDSEAASAESCTLGTPGRCPEQAPRGWKQLVGNMPQSGTCLKVFDSPASKRANALSDECLKQPLKPLRTSQLQRPPPCNQQDSKPANRWTRKVPPCTCGQFFDPDDNFCMNCGAKRPELEDQCGQGRALSMSKFVTISNPSLTRHDRAIASECGDN